VLQTSGAARGSAPSRAGWSNRQWLRSREDPMVEICVAVADLDTVHGLVQRLTTLFDGPSVSFDLVRREVRVRSEWESRSVVQVIDLVESWIATDGPDFVRLSIGDRSYTMHGPTCPTVPDRPAAA
jgi:hypothetical protein